MRVVKSTLFVWLCLSLTGCGVSMSDRLQDKPYHHIDGGFRNPPNSPEHGSSLAVRLSFFSKMIWRNITGYRDNIPPDFALESEEVQSQLAMAGDNSVTWIGHATFLVKLGDVKVLTDPIFSKRASPVSFAGPSRIVRPAIELDDLIDIDVIIISHSHYDHLDLDSLANLPNPQRVTLIVPLGLGIYAKDMGFKAIVELDWYERTQVKGLEVAAYPAIHWSSRSGFDKDKTLWMSYAMNGNGATIYHTGDTETHPTVFKDIGADIAKNYGKCDLGLMSVGAYNPRPMMRGAHMDPEGGVQVGLDVGCTAMVPMHWGTFMLSFEPFLEPMERFKLAAGNKARIMRIGETFTVEAK